MISLFIFNFVFAFVFVFLLNLLLSTFYKKHVISKMLRKHQNLYSITKPKIVLKEKNVNIRGITEKKYFWLLKTYICFMNKNFKKESLTNLYNNVNDLKIISKSSDSRFPASSASYKIFENIIIIFDNKDYAVYHELFHMASSVYKDGILYSGFRQASFDSLGPYVIGERYK